MFKKGLGPKQRFNNKEGNIKGVKYKVISLKEDQGNIQITTLLLGL